MEDLVCNICLADLRENGSIAGEINSCNHHFCYACISQWASIENSCPCCKVRFQVIRKKQLSCTPGRLANLPANAPIPGKILAEEQCAEVNQRPIFEDPSFEEWIQNVVCLVCGNADNEDQLLLCDDCDGACHTYCVHLDSIPEGEWFCSACTARRARENQRRQRRAQAQQQAEQGSRRRRQRTLIISDDEDEDEDDEVQIVAVRPARNRNNTSNNRRTGGGGGGDLDGFVVSDSEEQSSSSEEDLGLEERLRRRNGGTTTTTTTAAGGGTRRRGRGNTNVNRLQRQRHELAMQAALDSDFEEEVDWAEMSEDDDLDLDSPADGTGAAGGGGGGGDGWRRVVRNTTTTTRNTNNRRTATTATRATRQQPRRQRGQQLEDEEEDDFSRIQTTARHAVEVLTNNWDSIRRGTTTFNQVLARTNNTNNTRRLRQGREAARARGTTTADVIDLSDSPVVPAPSRPGGLSPPLGLTSISAKLRAELNACREKGAKLPPRKHSAGRGAGDASTSAAAARNGAMNSSTPEDAFFAAASIAATLNNNNNNNTTRGAAVGPFASTPRSQGSAAWRRTNNPSSPGSGAHRMRTVHDIHRGAEVARRTPNSGNTGAGGSGAGGWNSGGGMRPPPNRLAAGPGVHQASPIPLQQRLAARAAAEWGNTTINGGASGSGQPPPWRQVKRSPLGAGGAIVPPRPAGRGQINQQQQQPQLRTSPRKQHQVPQQQPQPAAAEDRRLPMFLRNKNTTSTITGANTDRLQSPSYSPPPSIPRRRNSTATAPPPPTAGTAATATDGDVVNAKQQAYNAVRAHVKMYLDESVITREQYKKIARVATRRLYQRHGGAPPEDEPNSQEVALVVDEAMISVIKGEI